TQEKRGATGALLRVASRGAAVVTLELAAGDRGPIAVGRFERHADVGIGHAMRSKFGGNASWTVAVRGARTREQFGETAVALVRVVVQRGDRGGHFVALVPVTRKFGLEFAPRMFAPRQQT